MFLKTKIGLTVFALYEILAVLLLHCPNTCNWMFGLSFCADSVLKYFIWCIAVPLVVFLVVMWIMEIIRRIRRRRSLLYKARHAVRNMASNIRDRVSESISSGDMEKLISVALVAGLKKYSAKNPRAHRLLNEIMSGTPDNIDVEYSEYEDDDDDYDMYEEEYASPSKSTSKPQKKKKKKKQ